MEEIGKHKYYFMIQNTSYIKEEDITESNSE